MFGRPNTRTEKHKLSTPPTRKGERWEPLNGWETPDEEEDEDSPGLEAWVKRRMSPTEQYLGRSRNKENGKYFLEIYPSDRCHELDAKFLEVTTGEDDNNNAKTKTYSKPPNDIAIQSLALSREKRTSIDQNASQQHSDSRKKAYDNKGSYVKTPLLVKENNMTTKRNSPVQRGENTNQNRTSYTWGTYTATSNNSFSNSPEFSVYKDVIKQHQTKSAPIDKGALNNSHRPVKSAPPEMTSHTTNCNNSLSAITRYAEVYESMKHGAERLIGSGEYLVNESLIEHGEHDEQRVVLRDSSDNQENTFVTAISQYREKNHPQNNESNRKASLKEETSFGDKHTYHSTTKTKTHSNKVVTAMPVKKVSIQEVPSTGPHENNVDYTFTKGPKWTQNSSTVKTIIKSQDNGGISSVFKEGDTAKYNPGFQSSSGFTGGKLSTKKFLKTPSKKERTVVKTSNKTGSKSQPEGDKKTKQANCKNDPTSTTASKTMNGASDTLAKFNEELILQMKENDAAQKHETNERLAQAKAHSRVDIASLIEMCRDQQIDYFPIGYLLPAVDSNIQSQKQLQGPLARNDSALINNISTNEAGKTINEDVQYTREDLASMRTTPDNEQKTSGGHRGFRGNTGRTPLQRARENTQKRLFAPVGLPPEADVETKTRWMSASPQGRHVKKNSAKGYLTLDERLATTVGLSKKKKDLLIMNEKIRAKTAK